MKPTFQGEVQFRRWSDSSTQGVQITFALPDSADLEPLKAKAGKRFMAVLVELGDDELPVEPAPETEEKPKSRKGDPRGPLCREACDYCKLPEFQRWSANGDTPPPSEETAKAFVLRKCQIESRKELDTVAYAADLFREFVRVPFMRWQRNQKRGAA